MIDKPHDALVKAIFSRVEHATELFRTGLPVELVEHIDFRRLEARPASFIDELLRDSATDLLFLAQFRDQDILLLLEHLSAVQQHAIVRAWRYTGNAWADFLGKSKAARRPPMLIPYVLHHSDKEWSAPTTMREYFEHGGAIHEALDPFVPGFKFVLDDLSAQSDAALRARDMSAVPRLTLWALKTARNGAALKATIHAWADVFREALEAWDEFILILRYTLDVCEVETEYIRTFLARELGQRAEEAYMTIGQAFRAEGRIEGEREGRIEALRSTLATQIQQRFGAVPDEVARRIEQAGNDSLELWITRVIPARTLAEIFSV